jgi:hypothetical protein
MTMTATTQARWTALRLLALDVLADFARAA